MALSVKYMSLVAAIITLPTTRQERVQSTINSVVLIYRYKISMYYFTVAIVMIAVCWDMAGLFRMNIR